VSRARVGSRWNGARWLGIAALLGLASGCDAGVTTIGSWTVPRGRPADAGASPNSRDAGRDAGSDAAAGEDGGLPDARMPEPTGRYLEAEDGELSGGFTIETDPDASNGAALLAPPDTAADAAPGPARARYSLSIERAGEYVIWGRIFARGADDNRFWFQLDGGEWIKWRISTGEVWYWDDFHRDTQYGRALSFALAPGMHELLIASAVPGARLDRLYVTADGDVPPGNDTPCDPPHTIELAGECQPSCGLLTGTRCGMVDCAGKEPLPAYDCDICCHVEM